VGVSSASGPPRRERADGLIRLSVGIEDIVDLLADIDQALG
jgi:cystathionine beta-lyase/cystathionine gamma-synthase